MKSSPFVFVALAGLVGIVACSSTSKQDSPSPTQTELSPKSGDCHQFGISWCGDTTNLCHEYSCDYITLQGWVCTSHIKNSGSYCNDYNVCIKDGHCDGSTDVCHSGGSGDKWFTCDPNGFTTCYCQCSYNGSIFTCGDSYQVDWCPTGPSGISSDPACGGTTVNGDSQCAMHHHCL